MAGVGIEGWVNGERRQNSSTKQLVFSIDYLIAYITKVMTLLPGDVIATGTPSGIGPLEAGRQGYDQDSGCRRPDQSGRGRDPCKGRKS